MSGTYTYPTEGSFKVINNKSGGTLSVTSSNSEIATASIDTNQTPPVVTVKPGTTAGEADIIVKSEANGEYAESKAIHKATIENGKIELSAKAYIGDYDGKEHDAVYDVEVTPKDAKLKYTLKQGKEGNVTESDNIPKVTGANEYTIAIEASKEGYMTTSITKIVTIGKNNAEGNLTLSANNGTLIYPVKKTFTITKNVSGGKLKVTSSDETIATASIDTDQNPPVVTITPKVIKKEGQTATIIVTSAATDNYEEQTAQYIVTISDIVPLGTVSVTANGTKTLEQGWKYFCEENNKVWLIYSNVMEISAQQITGTIKTNGSNVYSSSKDRQDLMNYLNGNGNYAGKWNYIKTGIKNAINSKGINIDENQMEVNGSPNIELLKKAYDQMYPEEKFEIKQDTSGWRYRFGEIGNYENYIDVSNYSDKPLFFITNCYWLASPSYYDDNNINVCFVTINGYFHYDHCYIDRAGARPVVSIPTSIFNKLIEG